MFPNLNKSLDILITGGIGDFIALESFFSEYEEKNIRNVFYATRAQKEISKLFDALPNYNIEKHITCFDEFNDRLPYLTSIDDLYRITKIRLPGVSDCSIRKKFKDIRNNQYKNHNSSFLKYELVKDIRNKFNLPPQYIVVHPCTTDTPLDRRELAPVEWNFLSPGCGGVEPARQTDDPNDISYTPEHPEHGIGQPFKITNQQKIVVLNVENYPIQNNKNIINLTNQTTPIESIEILKNANGYFGIDSFLSVLAAKLFTIDKLFVCQRKKQLNNDVYYYPQAANGHRPKNKAIHKPFLKTNQ